MWYVEKKTLGSNFLQQCTKYSYFVDELLNELFTNTTLESNLDHMRNVIRQNANLNATVVEGEIWFDNMTAYINILKTITDRLALRIIEVGLILHDLIKTRPKRRSLVSRPDACPIKVGCD